VYSAFSTIAIHFIGLHVLNAIFARSGYKWVQTNKKTRFHHHNGAGFGISINSTCHVIRATTGEPLEVNH
jgi:hypothetical protein